MKMLEIDSCFVSSLKTFWKYPYLHDAQMCDMTHMLKKIDETTL